MSKNNKEMKFVTPGLKLGVIEEFISGSGTYEQNGGIYSKITGHANIDSLNKKVSISPLTKELILPNIDSIITGKVVNVQSKFAIIDIFKIDENLIGGSFGGDLHISKSNTRYEKSIDDVCKRGDMIRAKVIDNKNGFIKLTTADRNLGVIRASCSSCGNLLFMRRNGLKCKICGNFERRKASQDYIAKDFQRSDTR